MAKVRIIHAATGSNKYADIPYKMAVKDIIESYASEYKLDSTSSISVNGSKATLDTEIEEPSTITISRMQKGN